MHLIERHQTVLRTIALFKQLKTSQIKELVFPNVSKTPCYRALQRLTPPDNHFLVPMDYRLVRHGEGGMAVYQIGLTAWHTFYDGKFRMWPKSKTEHTLAIADAYIELVRLERAGKLRIVSYATEPRCHIVIGGHKIEPDLSVSLMDTKNRIMTAWLEIDLATESAADIRMKLQRYWLASEAATIDDLQEWPQIFWITLNEYRRAELNHIIRQGKPEAQELFRVITMQQMAETFG